MIESINMVPADWIVLILCALFVGMSKVGVPGIATFSVPLLAITFGGKPSTGLLLPLLIMADIFGVIYYNRHAEWKYIFKTIPWIILGVVVATIAGQHINDDQFSSVIATVILIGVVLMIYRDRSNNKNIPKGLLFAASIGFLGGFTSMIGNSAGPIIAIYLLAMMLPKNVYIGTSAWVFFILNLVKVPFHVFVWKTITFETFIIDLKMLPIIALGAFLGIRLIKVIPEKLFRTLVVVVTALSALLLFF